MDIVSLCPLVASKLVWRAHNGAFALTVIVKATYVVEPGRSVLAPVQEPIRNRDSHWGDDPEQSVRIPTDRMPYKPRADVLLVGHAHAPNNQPVRTLVTRLVVGDVDKSIEVWCDRKLRVADAQLLEGPRFTRMPLSWDRTAGGPGSPNPIGVRPDATPDEYGTIAVANLQPPGRFGSRRADTHLPIGYGPVAPNWPSRMQFLGRLSRKFIDGGWEDEPLPEKFDAAFFQAAPSDQQLVELHADERIVLENLHPVHSSLVTRLPGLTPRAIADRATGEREEIPLVADTLWIDSDRGLCCVVWRGSIGLHHAHDAGQISIWLDGVQTNALPNPPTVTDVVPQELDAATTILGMIPSKGSALPFVGGNSSLAEPHHRPPVPTSKWSGATNDDGTGTMFAMLDKHVLKTLPFEHQQKETESTAPRFFPQPSSPESNSSDERYGQPKKVVEPKFHVAPPPLIGPLAKVEMEQDKPVPVEPPRPGQTEPVEKATLATQVSDEEDDTESVADTELSIEDTATIAAELAEGQLDRARVLHAHGLLEPGWRKNRVRWDTAIAEEQARGKTLLRGAHDAAYVKRVEGFRGPITANDYAKLLVAMERGRVDATLNDLRIQRPALMPIVRVWTKKMAADAKVGKEAAQALREAKGA